jgi:hypothetical protein
MVHTGEIMIEATADGGWPETATTRWAGERMDYDLALFALFSQRDSKRFRGNVGPENAGRGN